MSRKNLQAGFTLIEVLIAITVLAFLMLGVYTIVSNSVDTKDRVLNEDRSFVQVMRALDRLQGDVAQAWSPLYASAKYNETAERAQAQKEGREHKPIPFQATEAFPYLTVTRQPAPAVIQENTNDLIFFTAANRRKLQDAKQSRYAWVRHTLRRTEETDDNGNRLDQHEWIRYFENENIWEDSFNWDKSTPQLLLRGVKSLQFTFWDQRSEKFVERLQDSSDPDLLRALQVTLVWINEDGNEQTYTRVMRPLWPKFDTKKDEEAKELARRQKGNDSSGGSGQRQQQEQEQEQEGEEE